MDLRADIPLPDSPIARTDGRITEAWWRFFMQVFYRTGGTDGSNSSETEVALDVMAPVLGFDSPAIANEMTSAGAGASVVNNWADVHAPVQVGQAPEWGMVVATPSQGWVQATQMVTPTASPMTYQATSQQALHIAGGTVTGLSYRRGATAMALAVAATGQLVELSPGDSLVITYAVAPTLRAIQR